MSKKNIISRKAYEKELTRLQFELVKLQEWIKDKKLKVIVIFEGRDTAGKSGTIKRITQSLNARVCSIVALPAPNKREQNQWYFQRFVAHFPAEGEMVLFDRSWYNRACVEKVMGFCTDSQYENFLENCPAFEKLLIDSGIILIKYWFSISQEEQEERLHDRSYDPTKRWKLGTIDIDHFKKINDTYGHLIGDRVLVEMSATLQRSLREGDVAIRYGGEEFMILLPGAAEKDCLIIAERIRRTIEDMMIVQHQSQQIKLNVSIGLTSYPQCDVSNVDELINFADKALYFAKDNGRNQVHFMS